MDYVELVELLKGHGVHFAPGLTETELSNAEECYGIVFPKALREFYSAGLPISTDPPETTANIIRWDWLPVWNDFSEESVSIIRDQMEWPLRGILADVKNGYWMKVWGERPEKMEERFEVCRAVFAERSPKLIPVNVRRYVPQMNMDDPPVISVYGLDTIYYGENLEDYLCHEFLKERMHEVRRPAVPVPFWDNIITGGSDNFKTE